MHSEQAYSLNQNQQTASEVMEGGMQRSSQNLSSHGQLRPYLPKSTAKYDNQPKHKKMIIDPPFGCQEKRSNKTKGEIKFRL
jgi:predicted RNA methylase